MITNKHTICFKDWYTWIETTIQFSADSDINDWKAVIKWIMVMATFSWKSLDFLDRDDD